MTTVVGVKAVPDTTNMLANSDTLDFYGDFCPDWYIVRWADAQSHASYGQNCADIRVLSPTIIARLAEDHQ